MFQCYLNLLINIIFEIPKYVTCKDWKKVLCNSLIKKDFHKLCSFPTLPKAILYFRHYIDS
jgi:hypothetical protein